MRAIVLIGWMGCAVLLASCQAPTLKEKRELVPAGMGRAGLTRPDPPSRVLLITVAGLQSGDFLDASGHAAGPGEAVRMPNLAKLAREGAMGIAAFPPSPGASRASHATLVTGMSPKGHGVTSDATLDASGTRALPFLDRRMLNGVPLWDAAIGRGVLALDWPTTALARIEFLIPEVEEEEGTAWLERIRPQSTPMLVRALEARAKADLETGFESDPTGAKKRDPARWPSPAEKDAALVDVACSVVASERDPGLWLIRLRQSEVAAVATGVGTLETDAALGRIDAEIGRLLACLETAGQLEQTAIFVVGDVAYQAVHTTVSPNVALVRDGLIGRDPRSSTGVRSWLALVRSQGRSAYVYARDAANALAARDVLEQEADRTGAFRVVSAKRLEESGADPQAWFGLIAAPGYQIGNALAGAEVQPSQVRATPGVLRVGSTPEAAVGFVAWGSGIRPQVRLTTLDLVDVAPTIAGLLGLRLADDVEGRELIGIMRGAVPPPPPGPKRLGVDAKTEDYLRGGRLNREGR